MQVMVVDMQKEPIPGPYLVRMGGWTLERYLAEAPESARWEYVRGLVRFLLRLLDGYCETRGWGKVLMGPAAVQVLPEVVREPDLFVLPPEAAEQASGGPIRARPALIIEVVSPATRSMDLGEKAQEYEQGGVDEYWVVDAERREVIAHRRGGSSWEVERVSQGRLASAAVPGFWLEVEWLWARPLPPAEACLRRIRGEEEL